MSTSSRRKATLVAGTLLIAAGLLSPSANAQSSFSAKAIKGDVADAETGERLDGVIIVAQWKLDRNFVGDDKALLNVMETVTDKDGSYAFPAWGPVLLPPRADFGKGEDPGISYFKSGYWPAYEQNTSSLGVDVASRTLPLGEFQANGKTIKLKKWDGKDVKEYSFRVSIMGANFEHAGGVWRKYPHMVLTLIEEQKRLKKLGDTFGLSGVHAEYFEPANLEFLKRYENEMPAR